MPSRTFYRRHVQQQLQFMLKELDSLTKYINEIRQDVKDEVIEGDDVKIYDNVLYPLEKEISNMIDKFEAEDWGEEPEGRDLTDEEDEDVKKRFETELGTRFSPETLTEKDIRNIEYRYELWKPYLFFEQPLTNSEVLYLINHYPKVKEDALPGTSKRELIRRVMVPIVTKRDHQWKIDEIERKKQQQTKRLVDIQKKREERERAQEMGIVFAPDQISDEDIKRTELRYRSLKPLLFHEKPLTDKEIRFIKMKYPKMKDKLPEGATKEEIIRRVMVPVVNRREIHNIELRLDREKRVKDIERRRQTEPQAPPKDLAEDEDEFARSIEKLFNK